MDLINKQKKTNSQSQIGLGLKKSRFESLYKFRRKIDYYETVVSLTSLWRSSLFWVVFCVDVLILALGIYFFHEYKLELPTELPVFLGTGSSMFISEQYKLYFFLSVPLIFDFVIFIIGQGVVGKLKIILKFILFFKLLLAILFIIFIVQVGLLFLAY